MAASVPERCPKCGAPERRRFLVGNYVASNAIEFECETMVIEGGATSESTNCLRRQLARAQAEVERLRRERGTTRYLLHSSEYSTWECEADDCDALWYLEDGTPSENRMRYCPGCGRRIVAEVRDVEEQEAEDGEDDA